MSSPTPSSVASGYQATAFTNDYAFSKAATRCRSTRLSRRPN